MSTSKTHVEIAIKVIRTTEKALLVDDGKEPNKWVPISQIQDWCDGPDETPGLGTTSICIPEWLAKEKGMI